MADKQESVFVSNAAEAAAKINGNQYRDEVSREMRAALKEAGLVAIYGASDDLTVFDGAIYDEAGAGDNTHHRLTQRGLEENRCDEGERCPNWLSGEQNIRAQWDERGFSWFLSTELPHEEFVILEDGETYCRGIVVSLSDLPA